MPMWTCPDCERKFKTTNQSHTCVKVDIGELFIDKPDELVLAYDTLCQMVMPWQPNSVGATAKAIVFASQKAWLIVKPMKTELDLKFYYSEPIESELIRRRGTMGKKFAHHVRINHEDQISAELLKLLKMGYDFSLA